MPPLYQNNYNGQRTSGKGGYNSHYDGDMMGGHQGKMQRAYLKGNKNSQLWQSVDDDSISHAQPDNSTNNNFQP